MRTFLKIISPFGIEKTLECVGTAEKIRKILKTLGRSFQTREISIIERNSEDEIIRVCSCRINIDQILYFSVWEEQVEKPTNLENIKEFQKGYIKLLNEEKTTNNLGEVMYG